MISLRPYQLTCIDKIREAACSSRSILVVSPTGSGKTTIASELARLTVAKGKKVVWLAHRNELVDQAFDRLTQFGLGVGVISASSSKPPNPYQPVQVASIQTLIARKLRPDAHVLIWDEAHHAPSDLWSGIANEYGAATLVGFTATPERSDGRGLGAIYKRLVVAAKVSELVRMGHLVPCEIRRPGRKLRPGSIAQRPVDAYRTETPGRRAIVFSPSVIAAEAHRDEFREAGIDAELVHGETPAGERAAILNRFRSGDLRVLVNVYVLTEGFDAPETDCVILARGCGTAGTYLQMVGRGLRPAPGKRDCFLLDLHGVSHVLGEPEDDLPYSLEGRGIGRPTDEDVDMGSSCRVCGAPINPGEACAECGTEPKLIEAPTVTGDALVKYAKKRGEDDLDRARTLARWISAGREKGYKTGWAFAKYRAVYGTRPTGVVENAARAMLLEQERAA
jgi:DNA repair protein RadD